MQCNALCVHGSFVCISFNSQQIFKRRCNVCGGEGVMCGGEDVLCGGEGVMFGGEDVLYGGEGVMCVEVKKSSKQ